MGLLQLTAAFALLMGVAVCHGQACPPAWTFFQGNCYRWYNGPQRLSWDDAQAFCVSEASKDCDKTCNSNLVSINSAQENKFLLDYWRTSREPVSGGQHFWIGYKQESRTYFKWSDGSRTSYTNWDRNQPSNRKSEKYCAVMWKGMSNQDVGKWDDQPCNLEKAFICKFPA